MNDGAAYLASQQAAEDAAQAKAMIVVRGFQHDTATVAERQEYARAVHVLYPEAQVPPRVVGFGILIVFAFAVAGGIRGIFDPWGGALVSAFQWGVGAGSVMAVAVLLWAGFVLAFW